MEINWIIQRLFWFILDNTELKQIIDNLVNFQTNCHEWNQNIFDKLHIAYMIHIDINMKNLLKPGFALKSKQIFGKKGGGKRINLEVVEKLKEMFLADNIEKNQKLSAENMLRNL